LSAINKCGELKQRFLHVWYGIDQTIVDNAIDESEWPGRLRACVQAKGGSYYRDSIFSHMTRDVSVFVKCDTIFRLFFF